MADQKSGSLFVRLRSVRTSAAVAVFFGLAPAWFSVTLFFATTARHNAVDILQAWVKGFGDSVLDDRSWIIPSLLGLLVAVYASDYGARRHLNRLAPSKRESQDERFVIGALNLLAVAIAGFALLYLFITVATVIVNGTGYGHILDLFFACSVIFVLGAAVGMFSISTPERLLKLNKLAKKAAKKRLDHLGPEVGPGRPKLVIAVWIAWPLVAAAASLGLAIAWPYSGYAFLVSLIGLAAGGVGLGFAIAGIAARSVDRRTPEGRIYWWAMQVVHAIYALSLAAVFVFAFAYERWWGLGAGILALVIVVAQVLAWWIPLRGRVKAAELRWSPAAAHLQLMRRSLSSRLTRLAGERDRYLRYKRERDARGVGAEAS